MKCGKTELLSAQVNAYYGLSKANLLEHWLAISRLQLAMKDSALHSNRIRKTIKPYRQTFAPNAQCAQKWVRLLAPHISIKIQTYVFKDDTMSEHNYYSFVSFHSLAILYLKNPQLPDMVTICSVSMYIQPKKRLFHRNQISIHDQKRKQCRYIITPAHVDVGCLQAMATVSG